MHLTPTDRILDRFRRLYGDQGIGSAEAVLRQLAEFDTTANDARDELWDQRDVVLIAYGDQVRDRGISPLGALHRFLLDYDLRRLVNTVHLLPFYPYSSDDGFSVIDYCQVDPQVGTWQDVDQLGRSFHLMFDLVLNHISQHSDWFQSYLRGAAPFDRYFIEVEASTDTSAVTRPRSLPLLTSFETSRGRRQVWTTFSDDQIDLNYAEPIVLQEMIGVLLEYVRHGARIIRLDAIAYLWKELGTSCIHLAQTHQVVKLLRDVLQIASPNTLILTETNVPHAENVSYFGDGDEAQMVYQFSLPPLLLDAVLNHDASVVSNWLGTLALPLTSTTFFNFTASHDGIGVRPLEGLVSDARLERLVEWTKRQGGRVSTRRQPNGNDSPYELNVTYVDAMADPNGNQELHARRFLASQAVMLALPGIPGVYFHSLVGTSNDEAAVAQTGQPRRINRRKFDRDELDTVLVQAGSLQERIWTGYRRLLSCRVANAAFHPRASLQVELKADSRLLAFRRTAHDHSVEILVIWNVSPDTWELRLPPSQVGSWNSDLISGLPVSEVIRVQPFQAYWIEGLAS